MNPQLKKRKQSLYRKILCVLCHTQFLGNHSQAKYCSNKCRRIAMRKSWNKYGEKNREARHTYHRKYYESNKVLIADRIANYQKTPRGKLAIKHSYENQKKKFPEKVFARRCVEVAIKSGLLKKEPCEKCGAKKVEAHHPDYSQPLKVKWLCMKHHKDLHRSSPAQ